MPNEGVVLQISGLISFVIFSEFFFAPLIQVIIYQTLLLSGNDSLMILFLTYFGQKKKTILIIYCCLKGNCVTVLH